MERQSSKEYSVVFLVEGEKFKLRNLPWASSLLSAANSVGTMLEFAAFGSSPDVKYSRASAFWFFPVHNHGQNTFSQEKHQHVHVDRHLFTRKEISSKINSSK